MNTINKRQILFIEDNIDHLDLLKESLDSFDDAAGCEIHFAQSLNQAREIISKNKIYLVISDVRLPDGEGIEIVHENGAALAIVIMTSFGNENLAVTAMKEGALDYVVKSSDYFVNISEYLNRWLREARRFYETINAHHNLSISEEKYRALVEYSNDLIFRITRDFKCAFLNAAAQKFLDIKNEAIADISDYPLNSLFQPELIQKLKNVFETNQPENIVMQIEKAENYYFFSVNISVEAQNKNTFEKCCSVNMRDITEMQLLQNKIVESERLAAAGILAAGIAHEFNNILAIINSVTTLINMECGDILSSNQILTEHIKLIELQNKAGKDIVKQMLSFAKPEVLNMNVCSLKSIISNIIFLQKKLLIMNKIQVIKELDENENYECSINQGQIQQVIMNLVINAIQSMAKRETERILTISLIKGYDCIIIKISDTGEGFKQEALNNLFQPFFTTKGEDSNITQKKGTGLGLYISKFIIQQHKGTITAQNNQKGGAEFIITLPLK